MTKLNYVEAQKTGNAGAFEKSLIRLQYTQSSSSKKAS